ncbi:MAG TPA: hypothetical protein VGS28_00880 [Candidatus Saccharimonadales bacterium]|nr:hypothetical protein [Candidatus Saccharimonadales bacterium]
MTQPPTLEVVPPTLLTSCDQLQAGDRITIVDLDRALANKPPILGILAVDRYHVPVDPRAGQSRHHSEPPHWHGTFNPYERLMNDSPGYLGSPVEVLIGVGAQAISMVRFAPAGNLADRRARAAAEEEAASRPASRRRTDVTDLPPSAMFFLTHRQQQQSEVGS